jgi:hypothetical protein
LNTLESDKKKKNVILKRKFFRKNILENSRRNFEKRKTFGCFHSGTHFGRISKKLFSVIQEKFLLE